jgi:hypothetical protein
MDSRELASIVERHKEAQRKIADDRRKFASESLTRPGSSASVAGNDGWSKPASRRVSLFADEPRPVRHYVLSTLDSSSIEVPITVRY